MLNQKERSGGRINGRKKKKGPYFFPVHKKTSELGKGRNYAKLN